MRKFDAIIESKTAPTNTNVLWINGLVAKHFTNGKWVELMQEDTNESNDITIMIGNSTEIKTHNLSVLGDDELSTHVKIDDPNRYGPEYGTVYWIPNSGGVAHASNAAGSDLYYNIAIDGAISLIAESENLYLKYLEARHTLFPDLEVLSSEKFNEAVLLNTVYPKLLNTLTAVNLSLNKNIQFGFIYFDTDNLCLAIAAGGQVIDYMGEKIKI